MGVCFCTIIEDPSQKMFTFLVSCVCVCEMIKNELGGKAGLGLSSKFC